jgi:hypothetical protein
MQYKINIILCLKATLLKKGAGMMTKRNRKTKSGLQSAKSLTSDEFSQELTQSSTNKKVKKTKPQT